MSQPPAAEKFPVQCVRGVKDVLPEETPKWQYLEAQCRERFRRYGFSEIRTPIFEVTGLFARSIGAATDIVEKEMYTFADRNGQSLSLRPEGTAGVIRAYIQHQLQRNTLTRVYYGGPMFRHERPQAGRLRQFHQIGAEVLGSADPDVDVELLTLLADLFEALSISGLRLEVNSIGCTDCRPGYGEKLVAFLDATLDGLCENCQRRRHSNPLRVLDCKVPGCREATQNAPAITDALCDPCTDHHRRFKDGLSRVGIPFVENPRMVRGLDYYGRTAFEWISDDLGAQGTVAAGGRYDRLNAQLGGESRPGIGFGMGVERLLSLMPDVAAPSPDVFAVMLGSDAVSALLPVIRELRANGVSVDRAFDGGSIKSQMKKANKSGARFTLIVGESELASGTYQLKDMVAREQRDVAADAVVAELLAAR